MRVGFDAQGLDAARAQVLNYADGLRAKGGTGIYAALLEAERLAEQEHARDPDRFRYSRECAPGIPVVLGDARLTLAESPDKYDLIVLDAFSSDAIPVHLMTREAMAIYVSKLAPGGIVYFSTNFRRFKLNEAALGDYDIRDITAKTIP